MKSSRNQHDSPYYNTAAWIMVTVFLLLVIPIHLFPALLAGLSVYELVHILAPFFRIRSISRNRAQVIVVLLLSIAVAAALTLSILSATAFFRSDTGSLPRLLRKMAEIIEGSRAMLPAWAFERLPADTEGFKAGAVEWLRGHAAELQVFGKEAARVAGHILIGMVIGILISLQEIVPAHEHRPLSGALIDSLSKLSSAFRRVVFAQVRIAALNAAFTWLYLDVALPLFGIHLPFAKALVILTFLAGLIPIIGNLISNTVIVIISLSHSLTIAVTSMVFLIVVHKLEYFLNARIVGTQIRAKAWEILIAMLIMEAVFGIAGIIAAPIYYAYLKEELKDRELI
jgi:predicted PurR-regulated permease PerM